VFAGDFRLPPAGKGLGDWIGEDNAALSIGSHDAVANAGEGGFERIAGALDLGVAGLNTDKHLIEGVHEEPEFVGGIPGDADTVVTTFGNRRRGARQPRDGNCHDVTQLRGEGESDQARQD
jgi:hypothetical protein